METIGETPLVRLNKITSMLPCEVFAKVEYFNPGNSIKDRMAVKMIDDAEKDGRLKPGGTIIEGTSGNTGMGLALVACVRGYKCIFTTTDKQSKEKADILKAMGAEVIVCPTAVAPEDPRSYYSVSKRLAEETPNSFYVNQYDNLSNRQAHYEQTGPEIWEQTQGKITHLVVGAGTGGTIVGTGKYLKEKNPNIKIWGIDTYGSLLKKYHETGIIDEKEAYSYITEGIGEDFVPQNYDMDYIDLFEKVSDRDGAVYARKLAKEEGIFCGYSAGSAIAGLMQLKQHLKKGDVVVVILHDHGSRYVGKVYNDEWMRERGFLDDDMKISELIGRKRDRQFYSVHSSDTVRKAFDLMKEFDISQLPVMDDDSMVGSITERSVLSFLLENPMKNTEEKVSNIMGQPFPILDESVPVKMLSNVIDKDLPAVFAKDRAGTLHIITQYDIVKAL